MDEVFSITHKQQQENIKLQGSQKLSVPLFSECRQLPSFHLESSRTEWDDKVQNMKAEESQHPKVECQTSVNKIGLLKRTSSISSINISTRFSLLEKRPVSADLYSNSRKSSVRFDDRRSSISTASSNVNENSSTLSFIENIDFNMSSNVKDHLKKKKKKKVSNINVVIVKYLKQKIKLPDNSYSFLLPQTTKKKRKKKKSNTRIEKKDKKTSNEQDEYDEMRQTKDESSNNLSVSEY